MKNFFFFMLLLFQSTVIFAQSEIVVRGVVTDANETLIGVVVVSEGRKTSALTDVEGKYEIKASVGSTLTFTYLGMIPVTMKVPQNGILDVQMQQDTKNIDEVVVVGYGTQKKVNLTGSIASLDSKAIQDIPTTSLSNVLGGRLPGVRISQSVGKPGGSSNINIRSSSTWNNTDPLYVIDGTVRDKFAFDGLDASEVENLSVLKDGASAAIYGSRSANGVVLVTTKRGKTGKPIVTYNGTFGISDATLIPETQNAYDQAIFINDYLKREYAVEGDSRFFTQGELDHLKVNSNNWLKQAWKQPILTRHTLNVSGGNDKVRYFIGGSYIYETGSFNNLNYNKSNIRANVDVNITSDLVASLSLSTDTRNDQKPMWRWDSDNDTMYDLYKGLLVRSSAVPAYIDGKPNGRFVEWHPLEVVNGSTGYNKKTWTNVDFTASLKYEPSFVKGLSLKVSYNQYQRFKFVKQFNRPYDLYVFKTSGDNNHLVSNELDYIKSRNDGDYLQENFSKDLNYQLNASINYANTFGKHDISAMFNYEQAEGNYDWFDATRNGFISSAIDQMFAGSSDSKNHWAGGSGSEDGRLSFVGRLNYSYDSRYLVEFAFRYDGSVKFAPEQRWGFFPSGSFAWRLSQEQFLKDVEWVSNLKLRASVGLLGNDAVGGWQWMQRYSITNGAYFGKLTDGVQAGVIPNPNITWEKSLSYNIGVDAGFFDNRLTFEADVFKRRTYDILGQRILSLPSTFGADMPAENYAEMEAKGFEFSLGYQDKTENWRWYARANLGYAVNKIIQKDEAANIRGYKSEIGYNSDRIWGYTATDILRTQAEVDALPAGYTIMGMKPEVGMLNYQDIRGANSDTPDGKIDDNDMDYIANHSTSPVNYGLSLGLAWKGIALDVLLQGSAGAKQMIGYRGTEARLEASNFGMWTDHWTPENVDASMPSPSRNQASEASTFWLRDASYLRLKEISLSYTLPSHITAKAKMNNVKFFFVGTNLLLLQNNVGYYDPEVGSFTSYPLMKTYSFGVNISF